MKGTYITKENKIVKVLDFDEANNMAYVDFGEGASYWVGEPEYKEWRHALYIPDGPEQMSEEQIISSQHKTEEDALPEQPTTEMGAHIGGDESIGRSEESAGVGFSEQGNDATKQSEPISEETSKNKSEEKPKRKRIPKVK